MEDVTGIIETREKGCGKLHAEIQKCIIELFYNKGYNVNYSHIELTIPKDKRIPTKIRDKKGRNRIYDIAVKINNKIVYIEIDIRDVIGEKDGKIQIK